MKTINLIGYGNVGFHLANAIANTPNYDLQSIFCRKKQTTDSKFSPLFVHNITALPIADITIIAVSDQAITDISHQLPYKNSLVVHTSGTMPMQCLSDKNKRGVLYPLQTFSKNKNIDFQNIPLCLETEYPDDFYTLKDLAKQLSKLTYTINSQQREQIHITAVFVCNFVNHLFAIGKEISDEHEIDFKIFTPLIKETVNKIQHISPKEAQTGPAIRKDFITIEKHLDKITKEQYKKIYKLLTNSIIENGKKL